jgi:hypothetical protein
MTARHRTSAPRSWVSLSKSARLSKRAGEGTCCPLRAISMLGIAIAVASTAAGCAHGTPNGRSTSSDDAATGSSSQAVATTRPSEVDRWHHPFAVNGCRYAFPDEVSNAASLQLSEEMDRGSSGCTYDNNGRMVDSSYVQVHPWDSSQNLENSVEKFVGKYPIDDVSGIGIKAKSVAVDAGNGVTFIELFVQADSQHGLTVVVVPATDAAPATAVARLLAPRVIAG